jgi:hypothetical protein
MENKTFNYTYSAKEKADLEKIRKNICLNRRTSFRILKS